MGAVCILLAVKVNDPKDRKYGSLLETMERVLEVPAKDIYSNEFVCYAALEFTLFLPSYEVLPHLERVFAADGKTIDGYIGNSLHFMGIY